MYIQWYPGHMTKAMRMMQDSLKAVDCVIYVLDARAIRSSRNPAFDKMIGSIPRQGGVVRFSEQHLFQV